MDIRSTGLRLATLAGFALGLLLALLWRSAQHPLANFKIAGEAWMGIVMLILASVLAGGLALYRRVGGELPGLLIVLVASFCLGFGAGEIVRYWPR